MFNPSVQILLAEKPMPMVMVMVNLSAGTGDRKVILILYVSYIWNLQNTFEICISVFSVQNVFHYNNIDITRIMAIYYFCFEHAFLESTYVSSMADVSFSKEIFQTHNSCLHSC